MKELLFSVTKKDLDISYFSGTGPGGQHRNKHQNCVRMRHFESGAYATAQSNRERQANLREAFLNLTNSIEFKLWHQKKINEILTGKSIQQRVEESLKDVNLIVECKSNEGKWIKYIEEDEETKCI